MTDTWIFQGDRKHFNLSEALKRSRDHQRIVGWLVSRNRDEVHAGHRVYLWEAGPGGGLAAVTTVLTEPAISSIEDWQLECAVDRARFEQPDWRVRLRVDRILPRPIGRSELKKHPELAKLSILQFWQHSTFPVSPEEANFLSRLTARPGSAS